MTSALDTALKIVLSPPAALVGGGVVAGLVWKASERIEGVLTDDAKLGIAVGLLDLKMEKPARVWQLLLRSAFNWLFGKRQLSLRCCAASICLAAVLSCCGILMMAHYGWLEHQGISAGLELLALLSVPMYGSIWAMRSGLDRMAASPTAIRVIGNYILACCQATFFLSWFVLFPPLNPFWSPHSHAGAASHPAAVLVAFIVFVFWVYLWIPSVLLLFLISFQALRAAHRFDLGFAWFNRICDIEKKPLQSVGLMAGALCAMLYWGLAIVSRIF